MDAAIRILTPTDFERTFGGHDYVVHKWFLDATDEPEARHVVDEILRDREYIGGDSDLQRTYLDAIEEPLRELTRQHLQLVALTSRGRLTVPALPSVSDEPPQVPWRRTNYFVAPVPAYYRIDGASPARVHRLGTDCAGMRDLLRDGVGAITVYRSREAVRADLEDEPWCATCFLEAAADD